VKNIRDLLSQFPHVNIVGYTVFVKDLEWKSTKATFYMDCEPVDMEDDTNHRWLLEKIDVSKIAQIDLVSGPSEPSPVYGKCVFEIISKSPDRPAIETRRLHVKKITPLGYSSPIEFYSPKYDTQEALDFSIPVLRTTIYWNPNVIVNSDGSVKVDFYTADIPSSYSVVIEGICPDGTLIYRCAKGVVKVE
jgi:hypothetical protein